MSVSMTRAEGVTVLTVTSDGDPINFPLMCQILCTLCYCPGVNVFKKPPTPQGHTQSLLGALQIMFGVLNLGLGLNLGFIYSGYYYDLGSLPPWFGVLFIIVGITSILSERFSCSCMVVLSVILNLCGVTFALTTLIKYSKWIYRISYKSYSCERSHNDYWGQTTTPSPDLEALQEKCLEGQTLIFMLKMSISILLVTLSCLELCVALSSAILNIKLLKRRNSQPNDPQEPVPENITADPTL